MVNVFISNNLKIENPTDEMWKWVHQNLVIDNPDYYKKQRMGKWTGNTSQYIFLYERHGIDLYVPFGCLSEFYKLFHNECSFHINFAPIRKTEYVSKINLYPYQENAVKKALGVKNGIIVMPCGSGKTQTALDIVSRVGGRVLWLTHTQDLLRQSMDRAKKVLDTDATFGTITAGKVDIGSGITFATVQTMCKVNLSEYKNEWDVIIVDECQHCCGSPTRVTQFYKVVNSLSARYKIGLTATPKRADGLERSMFALLGDVIHEVKREEVPDTTCPVKVMILNTGYQPDYDVISMGDGTLDYHALLNDLITDNDRFEKVAKCVDQIGTSILVLASRVQYIKDLQKSFKGKSVCLSTLGQSEKAKAIRKEALRKLNSGELDVVFATYQLAKEGLDVPNLRYVIFATPEKDETTIIQSAGRVGRKAVGKKYGTVIDLVDDFSMYRGWAKKRQGYYKKIGAEVLI